MLGIEASSELYLRLGQYLIIQVQRIGISHGKNIFHGFHGFHGSIVDFTGISLKSRDTVKRKGPAFIPFRRDNVHF